jgi:hypothetical protein
LEAEAISQTVDGYRAMMGETGLAETQTYGV